MGHPAKHVVQQMTQPAQKFPDTKGGLKTLREVIRKWLCKAQGKDRGPVCPSLSVTLAADL